MGGVAGFPFLAGAMRWRLVPTTMPDPAGHGCGARSRFEPCDGGWGTRAPRLQRTVAIVTFLPRTLVVVLGLALLRAQEPTPTPTPTPAPPAPVAGQEPAEIDRVDRAIADYEAAKQADQPEALRRRALLWLGELDDERVTNLLRSELKRTRNSEFAAIVLEAISRKPRPVLTGDAYRMLVRPSVVPAVQQAAASAVAASGEPGVTKLLELVRGDDPALGRARAAAIDALLARGGEPALRELVAMVAAESPKRLEILRELAAVRDPGLDDLRVRLLREGDLLVAATAWHQLAALGDKRAGELAIDVLERLTEEVRSDVAGELIRGVVYVRVPDYYPVLLRMAAIDGPPVRAAIEASAAAVAQDHQLIAFLISKGLEDKRPAVVAASKVLLREAPPDAIQPLLTKVRAELRSLKKDDLDRIVEFQPILARDPSWRADLVALAAHRDPVVRTVGLSLLLEMGAGDAVVEAQKNLDHKSWALRSISYRYLTRFREVTSIPLLIARTEREDGRLADELSQALFAHTAVRCWSRREWDTWWRSNRTGFELPREETIRGGTGAGGGVTVSYYDIPLVSAHVAFLVDTSGSMMAQIGTDKKFTRLDAAKEQLHRVVEAMPKDHRCNVIHYSTDVDPIWPQIRKLNDANKKDLLAEVDRLAPNGGTNIFDALELAFRDGDIDTIYLLTDGQPTAGRTTDPNEILSEVKRWTRERQIVVHCIGLGIDSELLKAIANATGGAYKFVQ